MEDINVKAVKDILIKMFEALKPEEQKNYWNDFLFNMDGALERKFDIGFYRAIEQNNADFWDTFREVYADNDYPNGPTEVEAIRLAQHSKHYRWNDKYVRYGWDEDIKDCTLVSGNTVLELIEDFDGEPIYKTNEFVKYFGEQILGKLGISTDDVFLS